MSMPIIKYSVYCVVLPLQCKFTIKLDHNKNCYSCKLVWGDNILPLSNYQNQDVAYVITNSKLYKEVFLY
jgi:sulfatase maturation enzyme AslB (radical SAM superfamily)